MTVVSIRDFRSNQGKHLCPAAFKKAGKMLGELQDHPRTRAFGHSEANNEEGDQ